MPEDVSPRIARLKRELEAGNADALAAFWREAEEQQTPLIEPVPDDDPTQRLVTFVWRGTAETRNVVLFVRFTADSEIEDHLLERLLESDLWYKTYRLRSDLRSVYQFSPNDSLVPFKDVTDYRVRIRGFQPDPLNARQFTSFKDEEDPDDFLQILSLLELPDAPAQPWIVQHDDVPAGKVEMQRFKSAILENERRVWVYTPPGYSVEHEPYALLVCFDGPAYIDLVPTPTIIDNLLHAGKIPPLVVVLPDSLNQETRNRELPCYQPHVDFLTQELLPWVREYYHVTSEPDRTIVAGSSYGGLASAYAALQAPEVFGNVLSQSGSYWWGKDHPENPMSEWLVQQFIQRERLPLRFYLEAGLFEPFEAMVLSNRHMRDALQDKGYDLQYAEFAGGHDYACWRGSLANGLQFLLK